LRKLIQLVLVVLLEDKLLHLYIKLANKDPEPDLATLMLLVTLVSLKS
jgi:hypothetical protein